MKIRKLNEETLEQAISAEDAKETKAVARAMGGADIEEWDGPYGEVEEALDRALENALEAEEDGEISGDNILLIGRAGTGKTERIKKWAKQRRINLVFKDAQVMDPTDLGGIIGRDQNDPDYAFRLGNKEFNQLDEPRSVLFLDEINRASAEAIGSLLTLVQNHTIIDPQTPGGKRPLKGMLFTVAAMNPYNPAYKGTQPLDMAMRTRFSSLNVEAKREFQAEFFEDYFNKKIQRVKETGNEKRLQKLMGQLAIARKLMASPDFRFDDDPEEAQAQIDGVPSLNPRTLTETLKACDGTKESFLKIFMEKCNPAKLEMVEDILEDYIDVDDEANAALAYGDEDPFAQKKKAEKSAWDELKSKNLF